ncbi:hypothetical protein QBC39DRAFT_169464 [Podospora conica]|nr:hypothetical protein QBC39DRAFT_169464 [Schizothecium conicum]
MKSSPSSAMTREGSHLTRPHYSPAFLVSCPVSRPRAMSMDSRDHMDNQDCMDGQDDMDHHNTWTTPTTETRSWSSMTRASSSRMGRTRHRLPDCPHATLLSTPVLSRTATATIQVYSSFLVDVTPRHQRLVPRRRRAAKTHLDIFAVEGQPARIRSRPSTRQRAQKTQERRHATCPLSHTAKPRDGSLPRFFTRMPYPHGR